MGILLPCWFSLNNAEEAKAALRRIQSHFIRDICAIFDIPKLSHLPHIGQNTDGGISDFQNSGQSIIKQNCRNSRASDIDMRLGPVTELDKGNKVMPKNWRWRYAGKLWYHCHFSNIGQFAPIRKQNFINSNLFCTKTENRTKKALTQLSHYCFQ